MPDAMDALALVLFVGLAVRLAAGRAWDKTELRGPERPIDFTHRRT